MSNKQKQEIMKTTESKAKGVIKYRFTKDGVKLYDARIETIIYDNSSRNPSSPVINACYGDKNTPTIKYLLTYEEAVSHIKSFGFNGDIVVK